MRPEDLTIVTAHIDPFLLRTISKKAYNRETGQMTDLQRPVIVDDGALAANDAMMTGSMATTALLLKDIPANSSKAEYWMEYGRRVAQRFRDGEPFGIRCDSCTALAFYLLRENGCSGSITIVEQDQGKANGHWFLLVGCPEEAEIGFPAKFPRGSFVVDLWGVGVKRQRGESNSITCAVKPAACVYSCTANVLTKKLYWKGKNTVPTGEQFVKRTTVKGWVGDKSRSGKLQAIDDALSSFHAGKAGVLEMAKALQAWIDGKAKRQGDEIDSIRNSQHAMDTLREDLRWLGAAI